MRRNHYGEPCWMVWATLILAIIFVMAGIWPSAVSGADKTVTKGYEGSERVYLVEKPVSANSEATTTKGWIGGKRVDLRTVPTSKTTKVTRGWIDGQYIRTQSDSKGDSDGD